MEATTTTTTHTMLDTGELLTHEEWATRCIANFDAGVCRRIEAAAEPYHTSTTADWKFVGWATALMAVLGALVAATPA